MEFLCDMAPGTAGQIDDLLIPQVVARAHETLGKH